MTKNLLKVLNQITNARNVHKVNNLKAIITLASEGGEKEILKKTTSRAMKVIKGHFYPDGKLMPDKYVFRRIRGRIIPIKKR